VPVLEGILLDSGDGATQLAFSDEGLLAYAPGGDIRRTIPVWVDRQGNIEPLALPARIYGALKLSPDGKRLAIGVTEQKSDIYICDIVRGTETKLTKEGNSSNPLWTPDGERIVLARFEENSQQRDLLWAPADGSGGAEVLISAQRGLSPWSWSPDGKWLTFYQTRPQTGFDLSILPMEDRGEPKVILGTEFDEWGPAFSPDGRYIAYTSNRDGNPQIYVRPYPAMNRIILISRESGEEPLWSANGDELFYRNRTKWMVVSISTEPEFVAGTPQVLFEGPYGQVSGLSYDVAPDGRRFLVLQPQYDDSQVRELHVVTNWFEELKRLAPSPGDP
jgi:Tol biopolymer transport system component